jgi:hypothetical protein
MIDRDGVHEKIQEIIDDLHAFGAANGLSLGWLLESLRSRLLNSSNRDIQDFVREQRRKALN